MIKRVLFINPSFLLKEKFDFDLTYPLGIIYIAAVLEKEGYEVKVIDANALDLTGNELVKELVKFQPDIVGISCNFAPLHNPTLTLVELIKSNFDIPVTVGGNHACALKDIFISNKSIDFVLKGESEYSFLNLIHAINDNSELDKVNGIIYKKSGKVYETELPCLASDLDKLPMPSYHLLPMELYGRYSIITSRGCPFNCSYCASKVIFGKNVRYRSPESVLAEIEFLIKNYGNKVVWFCDDTFTSDEEYILQFCNLVEKSNLKFSWRCHTHVTKVSQEMLKKMKEAGCFCIVFGVESGSQKILKRMHKPITREHVIDAIRMTKDVGIDAATFFMVGMPGEDLETIMESYRLINESKPDSVSFCITLPLPGTGLFCELSAKKFLDITVLKWDYFFARIPGHREEEYYAATLASRWTGIPPQVLIQACIVGEKIGRDKNGFDDAQIRKMLAFR